MKNYKLLWGVIVVLLITMGSISYALIISFNRYNDIQQVQISIKDDLLSLQSELDLSEQANIEAINELNSCEDQLSSAEQNISSLEDEMLSCEEEITALDQTAQENVENLEEQVNSIRGQLSERTMELGDFRNKFNKLMCDPDSVSYTHLTLPTTPYV